MSLGFVFAREHIPKQRTSFFATGFSNKLKCTSARQRLRPSRSLNSLTRFAVRTRVVRLGICSAMRLSTVWIRFLAQSRVFRRGERGKPASVVMSLSVKSIASCGPATPRFSIVGILWPIGHTNKTRVFRGESIVCYTSLGRGKKNVVAVVAKKL